MVVALPLAPAAPALRACPPRRIGAEAHPNPAGPRARGHGGSGWRGAAERRARARRVWALPAACLLPRGSRDGAGCARAGRQVEYRLLQDQVQVSGGGWTAHVGSTGQRRAAGASSSCQPQRSRGIGARHATVAVAGPDGHSTAVERTHTCECWQPCLPTSRLARRVMIWQGEDDLSVPVKHAQW